MHTIHTKILTPFTAAHSEATQDLNDTGPGATHYFDCQNVSGTRLSAEYDLHLHLPPLDFLPNEIISAILEAGFFDEEDGDLRFRAIVAKISHRWREITHHTPSLWSVYHLSQGNLDHLIDELPISLKRSGDYPLTIHLNCFWDPLRTEEVMELFIPHSKRWESLSITTPNTAIFHYLHNIPVPKLTTFKVSHFSAAREILLDATLFEGKLPSLRNLMLRNISFSTPATVTTLPFQTLETLDIRGFGVWPEVEELRKLIGGSMKLKKLTLHARPEVVLRDLKFNEGLHVPIVLPGLKWLDIISTEWLSPHVATLARVFSCPNLEVFNVRDSSQSGNGDLSGFHMVQYRRSRDGGSGSGSDSGSGYTSVSSSPSSSPLSSSSSFSIPISPTLTIKSSNLYYATHCFNTSSTLSQITTLSLNNAHFPFWSNLITVFNNLPCLKNMIINNLDLENTLEQIGKPMKPIEIKELRKLEIGIIGRKIWDVPIGFGRVGSSPSGSGSFGNSVNGVGREEVGFSGEEKDKDLTTFIKLFGLPNLRSLSLCGISAEQWTILVSYFMECVELERYNLLESLSLTKISGLLDDCPNPTSAFPNLRHLTLIRVVATGLIKHLLPREIGHGMVNPWLNLQSLAICGDVNTSRPLLHQVVASRKTCSSSPPLKLYLDGYFQRNRDSWDWLNDNALVFLMPTVDLWNDS